MIEVVVIAATQTMRAGLRALLTQDPELHVTGEVVSLSDLEPLPQPTGVLVYAASSEEQVLSPFGLGEAWHEVKDPPALLVLADDPISIVHLPELPVRAWGVLSLDASPEELAVAVRALNEGLLVGEASLMKKLIQAPLAGETPHGEPPVDTLTPREGQVLQLLAQGLANKQIALNLGISEHTVKFHISSIYTKLGANSRTEAIRLGARSGLILL